MSMQIRQIFIVAKKNNIFKEKFSKAGYVFYMDLL